jgi:hypothetical protein
MAMCEALSVLRLLAVIYSILIIQPASRLAVVAVV